MSVGYSGGPETAINVTDLIWKAARILGFTFSMFSLETIQAANQAIFTFLLEGRIKPAVARTFLLEDANEETVASHWVQISSPEVISGGRVWVPRVSV